MLACLNSERTTTLALRATHPALLEAFLKIPYISLAYSGGLTFGLRDAMDWEASFSLSEATRQRVLRSSRLRNRPPPLQSPTNTRPENPSAALNSSSIESSIPSQPSISQRRELSKRNPKLHDDDDSNNAELSTDSSLPKRKLLTRSPHPTNSHSGNGDDANHDVHVTTSTTRRSILAPCKRSQKRTKAAQMETIDAMLDRGKLPALLGTGFFQCDALELAPKLLGKLLRKDEVVLQITEVEAYRPNDSACHGRFGVTPRTAPVFGPGGRAYVYLCYGLHIMLNIVADVKGVGAAVLIRSCAPMAGMQTIQARRGIMSNKPVLLTGPGKVGQALGLTTEWSNHPLYVAGGLEVLNGPAPENILVGPRVGIDNANPEDVAALWRFAIAGTPWISAPRNTLTPLGNSA